MCMSECLTSHPACHWTFGSHGAKTDLSLLLINQASFIRKT
uniref:Uncharacterized protein n=1 Tax=Arundo donax TaxID=35708 RepID=A0A0A9GYV3_ARUDO